MESKDIISLFEEIRENSELRYNQNPDRFKEMTKNLSKEDLTILFYFLAGESDIFAWFNLISDTIEEVASPNILFINLLDTMITKTKDDMAQGFFVRSLIDLGSNKPKLSWDIFYALTGRIRKGITLEFSGLLLGGIGKVEPKKVERYIERVLKEEEFIPSKSLKVACIKASRVMLEAEHENRSAFYNWLIEVLEKQKQDEEIAKEYISLLIDLSEEFTNNYCENVKNLLHSLPFVSLRRIVSFMLSTIKRKDNLKKQIIFAESLRDYEDMAVAYNIMYFLAKAHKSDKEKSFEFVKIFIIKDYTGSDSPIYYLTEKMMGDNREYYAEKFEKWVKGVESPLILMNIRRVISRISKSKEVEENIRELEKLINEKIHFPRRKTN